MTNLSVLQRLSGGPIDICVFDNRGIGKSSCPTNKDAYSIEIMAKDAIAVVVYKTTIYNMKQLDKKAEKEFALLLTRVHC